MQLMLFAVGGAGRVVRRYQQRAFIFRAGIGNQSMRAERAREREMEKGTQRASTAGADKMSWFNEACFVFVCAPKEQSAHTQSGRSPQ